MTRLTIGTLKRETAATYRGRPLVIELHASYFTLRQKGKRTTVTVDYQSALEFGFKILARENARLKAEAKKARRKAKKARRKGVI